jgi:hypothetical protein
MYVANLTYPGMGLCTLNQVDPYPITYNLSNPITYNLSSEKTGFKVCLSNATCSATPGVSANPASLREIPITGHLVLYLMPPLRPRCSGTS